MKIRRIKRDDFDAWFPLWTDYVAYHDVTLPGAVTQSVWKRLHDPNIDLFGLVALDDADKVYGFAHYVIHQNTWNESRICYLEDMGVATGRRGGGTGRAMIEHLAALAREQGWGRLYWHAKQDNAPARRLYDTVADLSDYVRYDYRF